MKIKSLISLLLIPVLTFSCKPKQTQNLEEMARLSTHAEAVIVKTVTAERTVFYHELISNGKVSSVRSACIPFRINGLIQQLNIINGQRVNEAELLAVIDDFDYRIQLDRARQALEKAEVNFKDDLLSNYMTTDTNGIAPAKIKYSRLRSGLNDAITSLSLAEFNYQNTRIKAPISGVVANLEAKQWNPSVNYKNLCTIINDETMEVEFPVIESEYKILEKNMPVAIIPFTNDSTSVNGIITEINPQVDENGMIKVKASFPNHMRLIDGMNVRVIIRKPVPNRLVVPKEALVIRQGKDVIFIRQDSLAIWKYTTVEFENSKTVSIIEEPDGVHAGDLVIISGNINLAHETVVKEK